MELTAIREVTLKAFCRLDEALSAEDEELLRVFYAAAVGYMSQAGVREPPEDTPRRAQYDLCVNYLVLDSWDRRDVSFVGAASSENPAFRRLLNQMKLTEPEGPPPQTSEAFAVGRAGENGAVGGGGKATPDQSAVFDGEDTSAPKEDEPL